MQLRAQVVEGIVVDTTVGRETYRLHAGTYPVIPVAGRAGLSIIEVPATLIRSSTGAALDLPSSVTIAGWGDELRPGAVVADGLVTIVAVDGDENGNPMTFHLEPADAEHRGRGITLVSREVCRIAGDAPNSLHKVIVWGDGWIATIPADVDDAGDDIGTIRFGEVVRIMDPRGVLSGNRLTVTGVTGARFVMTEMAPVPIG